MIVSSFDIDRILSDALNGSDDFRNVFSGSVYLNNEFPNDSASEFVVINSGNVVVDRVQTVVSEIIICVPDVKLIVDSKEVLSTDTDRLDLISGVVSSVLSENYGDNYGYFVSGIVCEQKDGNMHCVRVSVEFYIHG